MRLTELLGLMVLPQLVATVTRGVLAGLPVGCDFLPGHFLVVQYPELPARL